MESTTWSPFSGVVSPDSTGYGGARGWPAGTAGGILGRVPPRSSYPYPGLKTPSTWPTYAIGRTPGVHPTPMPPRRGGCHDLLRRLQRRRAGDHPRGMRWSECIHVDCFLPQLFAVVLRSRLGPMFVRCCSPWRPCRTSYSDYCLLKARTVRHFQGLTAVPKCGYLGRSHRGREMGRTRRTSFWATWPCVRLPWQSRGHSFPKVPCW